MIIYKLIIKISKLLMVRDTVPPKNLKNSKFSNQTGTQLNNTMNQVPNTLCLKMNLWI
jgi:hypothetical protein